MFQYLIYSWNTVLEAGEPEDVVYNREEALTIKRTLNNAWIAVQIAYYARTREQAPLKKPSKESIAAMRKLIAETKELVRAIYE